MSRLAHHAERLKLARLLGVDLADLGSLEPVPAEAIRQLRERIAERFFEGDAAFFKRVVAASRLLPVAVLALVAERVLGALLAARIAGQMDVERGVGIAERLPTTFLAEVCLHLDPQRARSLIRAMPVARVVDVALTLAKRQEYVAMGRFVDAVTDDAIRAVLPRLKDQDLLHTAFFAENAARLADVVSWMPEERLVRLIRTTAQTAGDGEGDLWPETLALLQRLPAQTKAQLVNLAGTLEPEILESLVRSVDRLGLWAEALPLIDEMSEATRRRFADLDAIHELDAGRCARR